MFYNFTLCCVLLYAWSVFYSPLSNYQTQGTRMTSVLHPAQLFVEELYASIYYKASAQS